MTFHVRQMPYIAALAAVIVCFGATNRLAAQSPAAGAKNVFYTASGTFGSVAPCSPEPCNSDLLLLANQPFTLTVVALSSLTPSSSGAHWAKYTGLKMSGAVNSGLLACGPPLPPNPPCLDIQSQNAAIELATGNPNYDVLSAFMPVYVGIIGQELYITTTMLLPKGTLTTSLIRPFTAPVVLDSTTTITYSNHINSTTLEIQSGTLATCVQGDTGCPPPLPD